MFAGKMRHKDNAGNEGVIEAGGVQWMTAGRGIVHSEMPEQEDGLMWGTQLWVNLPSSEKMTDPIYQEFDAAGLPTSNGTASLRPASEDAEVTTRLRAAGAVLLGKLNMHECALGATTDNPHHGPTHNPWRAGYTPGGSSGGSGAAVAAGLVLQAAGWAIASQPDLGDLDAESYAVGIQIGDEIGFSSG